MWVLTVDGAYVNLAQGFRIETNDQGNGTFVLVVHGAGITGILKTATTFTSNAAASAAAQAIVSGTTLTN